MRLFSEDTVTFARADVMRTQRDDMVELAQYLPNIDVITVLEREELEDGVRLVNLWKAAATEIPRVIRPFVKPEMMQWKDHARWYNDTYMCEWRLELGFFTEQVKVSGTTRFEELGADRCKVIIDGNLAVDVKNMPGVPRLLAGKIVSEIEKLVVKQLTPNLTGVNRGLESYLKAKS